MKLNKVFVEVDIDKNTQLARKYGITSIPRVIVEVANNQKDVLIDKSGFRSKNQHLSELQYINQFDLKEVYLANNESEYGSAYRNLFISDKKKSYTTLLKLSSKHFKKALKKETNELLDEKKVSKPKPVKEPVSQDNYTFDEKLYYYILCQK